MKFPRAVSMPSGFMDASIRKKSELDYPNFGDIEDGLISYTCYCYFGCCFCNLTICVVYPNGLHSRTMALGGG